MDTEINPSHVYTIEEVADILRVGRSTIYRWCRNGRLNYSKIGRSYRFLGSMVIASIEAARGPH